MLELRKTTQTDFDAYIHRAIDHLANELSEARDIPKPPALKLARESFKSLFPEGQVDSPDQYFFDLVVDGAKVGFIHFGIRREDTVPYAYIWDFEIYESHRGQGHAQASLAATEKMALELGLRQIKLNVFGHNLKARRLYQKCGYQELSMTMGKKL